MMQSCGGTVRTPDQTHSVTFSSNMRRDACPFLHTAFSLSLGSPITQALGVGAGEKGTCTPPLGSVSVGEWMTHHCSLGDPACHPPPTPVPNIHARGGGRATHKHTCIRGSTHTLESTCTHMHGDTRTCAHTHTVPTHTQALRRVITEARRYCNVSSF